MKAAMSLVRFVGRLLMLQVQVKKQLILTYALKAA